MNKITDEQLDFFKKYVGLPTKKELYTAEYLDVGTEPPLSLIFNERSDLLENIRKSCMNALTYLPDGIFDNLTNLERLHLEGNPLSTLPDKIFSKLKKLVHPPYL